MSKDRKPIVQDYYTEEDYDQVLAQLPDVIKEAEKKAAEVLEPTIHEKRKIMAVIKDFIRSKNRKVYGGTALNELLIAVNPDDAIYGEILFSDIEFYSPTPVPDLVELTNLLYSKGYKHVQGKEAQHEETYIVYVNFQQYCDISYVPVHVYYGIRTIEVDGINYTHPHFMLIDYLRMINDPLNAAALKWEKIFPRMYKLLKNYPLEYFDKQIQIPKPSEEFQTYFSKIKTQFMAITEVQESCLISGFEAYNFFVRHAANDRTVEQQARTTYRTDRIDNLVSNVPFLEFVSVNYRDTAERLYNFIREIVMDAKEVTLDEYFPLFQFTGFSVMINYKGNPIARVFDATGFCIPNIKTTRGYMYVSYQYLLMTLFINKFRSHLDKNQEMYFNYGIAVSNLVKVRNIYLTKNNLPVINKTVFGEFKIGCVGSTVSYIRMGLLRGLEKHKKGKPFKFTHTPQEFLKKNQDDQAKTLEQMYKYKFRNTSGNKITNSKNLSFKFDEKGNIVPETDVETDTETDAETDTETDAETASEKNNLKPE